MNQRENMDLSEDVADIEESLYELHLRMHHMTLKYQRHGSDLARRLVGLAISELDLKLIELYRQAAALREQLRD
nr:hypothetical protein [uncultured Enterobacter sp.]